MLDLLLQDYPNPDEASWKGNWIGKGKKPETGSGTSPDHPSSCARAKRCPFFLFFRTLLEELQVMVDLFECIPLPYRPPSWYRGGRATRGGQMPRRAPVSASIPSWRLSVLD
jgi:hypothetical protein